MKLFYDHLVFREEISKELRKYNLTVQEHIELVQISDETIHFEILDVIFSNLPKQKHKEFLDKMHQRPHDVKLIEDLKAEINDIEAKIEERAKKAKALILTEIKRSEKK